MPSLNEPDRENINLANALNGNPQPEIWLSPPTMPPNASNWLENGGLKGPNPGSNILQQILIHTNAGNIQNLSKEIRNSLKLNDGGGYGASRSTI